MATQSYERINWEDADSTATPLNADNLNHMEDGIAAATQGVQAVETAKATRITSSNMGSGVDYPTINAVVQYLLAHYYTKAQLNTEYWDTAVIPFFTDKFVTPEMFDAVGDGDADDSQAIQDAIDAADANKVVLIVGNYKINSTIVIKGRKNIYQVGNIEYTGEDSAIRIQNVSTHCHLKFDQINAPNGNGIEFYAGHAENRNDDGKAKSSVQYVKLEFDVIKSKHKCIYFNLDFETGLTDYTKINWINEIVISGGHLTGYSHKETVTETVDGVEKEVEKTKYEAEYGIYGDAKGYPKMNNIKVYNVSIEGIKNGYTDAAGTAAGIYMANRCQRWSFINMRYAETFDILMKTEGKVENFTFYGSQYVNNLKWNFSNETTGAINMPTYGETLNGNTQGLSGFTRIVKNGTIEKTVNTQVKPLTSGFSFNSASYDDGNRKTLIEHGIVPETAGIYFVSINTNTGGEASSVYIVRVRNNAIDNVVPIYEGSHVQAPRVATSASNCGLLTKQNSTSTTSFKTMTIRVCDLTDNT